MRIPFLLAAGGLLAGCCDCVVDHVDLTFTDTAGAPATWDRIVVEAASGPTHDVTCETGDCTTAFVPLLEGEGRYELTIEAGGVSQVEIVEVEKPAIEGVCCGDVFSEERTVVLGGL